MANRCIQTGAVAQLGERCVRNAEVGISNLLSSTRNSSRMSVVLPQLVNRRGNPTWFCLLRVEVKTGTLGMPNRGATDHIGPLRLCYSRALRSLLFR